MNIDYESLLKKARKELPESVFQKERFEIPKIRGHLEGTKTILTNLTQIAQTLRRPVQHMVKYITREIGAPAVFRNNEVIINRKVPSSIINEKIKKYANTFVLCMECGKPDTTLTKENSIYILKCNACGTKNTIKSKI